MDSKKFRYILVDIFSILAIVTFGFVFRTYAFTTFQVSGPSMCSTINTFEDGCEWENGEFIALNKFSYQQIFDVSLENPQRGNIIVFHSPTTQEYLLKRIIGLPGEKIEIRDGYVFIINKEHAQGFQLDEPYLGPNEGKTYLDGSSNIFKIPEEHYFVLGDNRMVSSDSRSCFQRESNKDCQSEGATPFITRSDIEGKAWFVIWPLARMRVL